MKTLIIFCIPLFLSCSGTKPTIENKQNTKTEQSWQDEGFVKATIVDYSSLDGCTFLIEIENDTKQVLFPVNLPVEHQKNGLKIWLKYRQIKPIQSVCMKGIPVNVEEIKARP